MELSKRQEVFMYQRIRYLQRLIGLMQLNDNTSESVYKTATNELKKLNEEFLKGSI